MDNRSGARTLYVTACTVLVALRLGCDAAELSVTVEDVTGKALAGSVVIAEPGAAAPRVRARAGLKAVMDQRNLQFVPEVLIVQTGTAVEFPNSDQVRHQVYSFSAARKFELGLYKGRTPAPVLFDKPGLVTLGCNIHDDMLAYIWVTDSPWFGISDALGAVHWHDLSPGDYTVRIWHPRLAESADELVQHVTVSEQAAGTVHLRLRHGLRPAPRRAGTDTRWDDY